MKIYFITWIATALTLCAMPQKSLTDSTNPISNPMTPDYLSSHLRKELPRLVLTPEIEQQLISKIQTDPVIGNVYQSLQLNARQIYKKPLLKRVITGRRMLDVSREMLYRMNMLGITYRIEKDPATLQRINDEILAACAFSDWNPSHFLDVAEMALAVSLALDWTGEDLPQSTVDTAKSALINKALLPSYKHHEGSPRWISGLNNWNQVCHGGMIAAAIATAETNPELAAKTISRALDNLHYALAEYSPNGVYIEGPTYWGYGTSFTAMTASMLTSAFGTDYNISASPGFIESAWFRLLCESPSGLLYNFADSSEHRSKSGDFTLAWFATHTGNSLFYERDRFLQPPKSFGKLGRLAGAGLVWLSEFTPATSAPARPTLWAGNGPKPLVIFSGENENPDQYYFSSIGGQGDQSHGDMDGGSFIFELDGVRWSVDLGMQPYEALEAIDFNLWDYSQKSDRWTLLSKSNFGHSTLTINNSLHIANGKTSLTCFSTNHTPSAILDMTQTFGDTIQKAKRHFTKDSNRSLAIEDRIISSEKTKLITWQMMTTADAEISKNGITLKQQGKTLWVENLSHPEIMMNIVSMDPPPLPIDKHIKGLKRIELRIPVSQNNQTVIIRTRLSSSE